MGSTIIAPFMPWVTCHGTMVPPGRAVVHEHARLDGAEPNLDFLPRGDVGELAGAKGPYGGVEVDVVKQRVGVPG